MQIWLRLANSGRTGDLFGPLMGLLSKVNRRLEIPVNSVRACGKPTSGNLNFDVRVIVTLPGVLLATSLAATIAVSFMDGFLMSYAEIMDYPARVQAVSMPIVVELIDSWEWSSTAITGAKDQRRLGDLRIKSPKGTVITLECKADQWKKSLTMFAEWFVDRKIGKPGWVQYCQANRVAYHWTTQGKICSFDPNDLRRLIADNGGFEGYESRGQTRRQSDHESFCEQATWGIVIDPNDIPNVRMFDVRKLPRVPRTIAESHSYAYRKQQVTSSAVVGCERGEFTSTI